MDAFQSFQDEFVFLCLIDLVKAMIRSRRFLLIRKELAVSYSSDSSTENGCPSGWYRWLRKMPRYAER
jgi:hypothetical protein